MRIIKLCFILSLISCSSTDNKNDNTLSEITSFFGFFSKYFDTYKLMNKPIEYNAFSRNTDVFYDFVVDNPFITEADTSFIHYQIKQNKNLIWRDIKKLKNIITKFQFDSIIAYRKDSIRNSNSDTLYSLNKNLVDYIYLEGDIIEMGIPFFTKNKEYVFCEIRFVNTNNRNFYCFKKKDKNWIIEKEVKH